MTWSTERNRCGGEEDKKAEDKDAGFRNPGYGRTFVTLIFIKRLYGDRVRALRSGAPSSAGSAEAEVEVAVAVAAAAAAVAAASAAAAAAAAAFFFAIAEAEGAKNRLVL
jgi:zona occludens toxin (predicted ATPase)